MKKKIKKQKVYYFKRWTRKKYASFNSIRKVIIISVISLNCSFVFNISTVFSQTENDSIQKIIELNEVEISLESTTQSIQKSLLKSIVTKNETKHVPAQSINELLDYLPGLDIRQRGSFGTQADISFRGGSFDQTIVLLNGINITDPQTGHYTMNIPVNINIIKQIEIFRSTSAFLYGVAPFSGAIHIITQPDTINQIGFHVFTGMHGLIGGEIYANFQTRKFKHLLSFDYNRSDGYKKNADFNLLNTFYQGVAAFRKGKLDIQMGFNDKAYGANSFYSLKYPNQFEHTQTWISSIQWQSKGIVKWKPSLYYRYHFDCFELFRNQDKQKNNYHNSQVGGFNLQTWFSSRIGKTTLGSDLRIEDIVSTSLGDILLNQKAIRNEKLNYTHGKTRYIVSLSLTQGFVYKNFISNISLLLPYYVESNLWNILPAADVSYNVFFKEKKYNNIDLWVVASAAKTLRMPTFTDLYYHTGDILGNKNLKPEQAYTVELGVECEIAKQGKSPYFVFKTDVFGRWTMDMIDYSKQEEDSVWRAVNHANIFFTGIETSLNIYPENLRGENVFVKTISLDYSYLYSNKKTDNYLSRYVLDHLTHKLSLTFNHSIYKTWGLQYVLSYNQRKGAYISYKNTIAGELISYKPYTLLDIRMYYYIKDFYVYIEASNVLNVTYYDIGGLDQAGIWVKGGIKYQINIPKKKSRN